NDGLRLRVLLVRGEAVDVRRPGDGVAADADAGREADVAQLVHELVGQRARLADQPDVSVLGDVPRDDADVGAAGRDETRAVRADDAGTALVLRVPEEL